MDWFVIALTSLLTLITPVNAIGDRLIADQIRSRVYRVEELSVRLDNAPNFQVLQGKVERLRIASKGLEIIPELRLEQVQLETDPIDLRWRSLSGGNLTTLRRALRQPLQGALALVITEGDVNRALAAPALKARLETLLNRVIPEDAPRFQIDSIQVDFLDGDRLAMQLNLRQGLDANEAPAALAITIETGLQIGNGDRLTLIDPVVSLDGRKVSSRIVNSITGSFVDKLSLKRLEPQGITARVLRYDIGEDRAQISVFARVQPSDGP